MRRALLFATVLPGLLLAQPKPLLIDTHNDVTLHLFRDFDIGKRSEKTHTDLPRLREGGVGAVFFAVYVSASYVKDKGSAHHALEIIDTVRHDVVERYPNDFALATTAAEIESARRQGKIAALMGIEGGHAIENSLRLLRDFFALGVRYMTLTHSNTNDWADSSGDITKANVPHHNGLTDFGREVVAEMNRLGMMVDISHVADKTFWDVLAASKAPLIASHSSCRALCDVPRNMTDDMIVALAKKGGVLHINFACEFLAKGRRPTLDDVVTHIDHVKKIAGVQAVGIGSDFDGITCAPEGLDSVDKFPNLTRALLAKGYTETEITQIYGGNTLRLMRAVEASAQNRNR